jgi:hypothetical protein
MAQARTRLWFLPTSPRSPDKIQPELTILQAFEGKVWDKTAQAEFFRRIVDSGSYESAGRPPKEPDQPGRERVHRAPRALGFARAKTGDRLVITPAGHALIEGYDPADLFLHQLLKLQFPSPNHGERDYRELFRIKPFLEVLRLVREVESISKYELQAFALTLIDYHDLGEAVAHLQRFRAERAAIEPGRPRREFEQEVIFARMAEVYAEDLATEGISLRERGGRAVSPDEVLATKVANARDYADAAMRYFQRTGLFTFSDFRSLRLLPERAPDVDQILATVSPEPEPYEGTDLEPFWAYLGDPALPALPLDEPAVVRERFEVLRGEVAESVREAVGALPAAATATVPELKHAYTRLQDQAEAEARDGLRTELARKDIIDELVATFAQIASGGIIDRSLILEWNVWRVLAVLDDGDIRNNFKLDRFGQPVTHAPGNMSDIECTYEDFHLLTEVTVSSGARQHATEGEPVTRHVGLYQRRAQDAGDRRPVFALFIAERLEATVIADFYSAFTTKVRAFGGAVKIVPLEISDLVALIEATRERLGEFQAGDLRQFLERASLLVTESMDEEEWRERVTELARVGF